MPLSTSIRVRRGTSRALAAAVVSVFIVLTMSGNALANSTPLGSTQILDTAQSSSTCVDPLVVQPFTAFGDQRDYVLAPGGAFEDAVTDGWQLGNGATLATDGRNSSGSLALPPGASAITPAMCIDLSYPQMRFYSKAMGSAADAKIGVEVVYPDVRNPAFEEIKQFDGKQGTSAGAGWRLSDDVDLKPDLGGKDNVIRRVALRFTSLGSQQGGAVRIDDVYIDPKRR